MLSKLVWEDFERTYLIHLPKNFDKSQKLPLVLVFHGAGGTGELAAEITGWPRKADEQNFIAVFPNGLTKNPDREQSFIRNPQFWNAGTASSGIKKPDDVGFIQHLIAQLQQEYSIDNNRIYATGFSNGAAMAWRLGVELSTQIAAIGPVAGFLALPDPKLERPVPALVIACEEDPMIPIDGGVVRDIWSKEMRNRPSLRAVVKQYAIACGCQSEPKTVSLENGVTNFLYAPDCTAQTNNTTTSNDDNRREVHFYTIAGAGHTYPGGNEALSERMFGKRTDKLNATDLLWQYFASKAL